MLWLVAQNKAGMLGAISAANLSGPRSAERPPQGRAKHSAVRAAGVQDECAILGLFAMEAGGEWRQDGRPPAWSDAITASLALDCDSAQHLQRIKQAIEESSWWQSRPWLAE